MTTELLKKAHSFVNGYYPNGEFALELKAAIEQAEKQEPEAWRLRLWSENTEDAEGEWIYADTQE